MSIQPSTEQERDELVRTYVRIRDEIDGIKSDVLLREAGKYEIPISSPVFLGNAPVSEPWRRSGVIANLTMLTENGRAELRVAIRQEKKDRRESRMWWVSILFGLIGALTGLVSVFRH